MNASGWSPRLQRGKRIDMSLIPVDTALQAGITDVFAVGGEFNPHLFTHPLEDLGHFPELGGIHVVDAQHRVLMALLRAKRRGATVRTGTDHLQGEVCIVTMYADENTDRKSTRLNSSHLVISYAVFCLKKKKKLHVKYNAKNIAIEHGQA